MTPRTILLVALALLGGAACGDDDDATDSTTSTSEATTTTDGSATTTTAAEGTTADTDGEGTTTDTAGGGGGGELADACSLVPDAEAVSGLELGEPVSEGNNRRSSCAFSATEAGQVGLTVAVQGGERFDRKAEQSERALGPGEEVDGLGDRALFFFSDDDIPEGVGGMLVDVGDRTLEVTLQGIDEEEMRDAATALAELAISNLSS